MAASPSHLLARIVLGAVGLSILVVGLGPLVVVDDLADPLASRWSFDGEVTATMSHTAMIVMGLLFLVPAAGALFVVAATRREVRSGSRTLWTGAVAMVGAVVAGAMVMTVAANHGQADSVDVPGPAVWQVAALVALSIGVAVVTSWAASGLPEAPRQRLPTAPLDVPETTVVAWSRSLSVRWLVALSAVLAAVGLGLLVLGGEAWTGIVVLVSGLPAMLLARIEVFADRRGLTVAYGPWNWPRTRIPLDRIESATAIDLRPSEWGGWGYRGSVKVFRQAAVVLRAGAGLRIDLTDGRRFAVTIDDPETAAAVLTRERTRP